MNTKRWLQTSAAVLAGWMVLAGCSEEETAGITLDDASTSVELYAVVNQDATVKFKAGGDWKATCAANWLTFSPKSGQQGNQTITVTTTATNRTRVARTAQLLIESGGKKKTVNVKQRGDYAIFDDDEVNFPSNGATVGIRFKTNLEQNDLLLYSTAGIEEWIKYGDDESARTRTDYEGQIYPLHIQPNLSRNPRDGAFFLCMEDKDKNILGLDTLFVYQEGTDTGVPSADFSADGKVELLNQATEGKGIPIVLMGDGFLDTEIADSTYARVMHQAMENLFSEEPVKSLRAYFNVYMVTAVSAYQRFWGTPTTALGTIPDHQTMGIDVDGAAVMKYIKKVEGIDSIHTLAVVIPNLTIRKGVTYMMRDSKRYDYSYAIALCPMIDSLKSETFRQVLTHEAIGHGFAKLADEYVRSTEGSATDDDIRQLKEMHEKWAWYLNVDSEKDSTKVLWKEFIFDSEFANEKIGTYEGGYTYYKGVYRPSQESMMRSNNAPFNAPSRQAIYKKVMQMALDKTPTYEEFKAFDKAQKPTVWSYQSRTRQADIPWRPAPPRVILTSK